MADAPQSSPAVEESAGFLLKLRLPAFGDPFRWLSLGARDFARAPAVGLFFGACFVAMGWALLKVFENAPAFVLGLSAGFLAGRSVPVRGALPRERASGRGGETPRLGDAVLARRSKLDTLAIFGVILLVLEMLWARASLVVFALSFQGFDAGFRRFSPEPHQPEEHGFHHRLGGPGWRVRHHHLSVSVVSIPMILDRHTDAITSGLTSIRLVLSQPAVMIFWAAVITFLVALAMLPGHSRSSGRVRLVGSRHGRRAEPSPGSGA